MTEQLPLLSLLSQALIGLTIEIDDEIERRLPHFTSSHGSTTPGFGSPWLIAMPMWAGVLRHVGPGLISTGDLAARSGLAPARVKSCVNGLVRWGYVLERDKAVLPTVNGKRWHETIPGVIADVEARWEARHGTTAMDALRDALGATPVGGPDVAYLPIVAGSVFRTEHGGGGDDATFGLVSLLSRAVLGPTLRIEPTLPLVLPVVANVVRVLAGGALPLRDVPTRCGVAKQAVTTMVNQLERSGHVAVVADGRTKRVSLTDAGLAAHEACQRAVAAVDDASLRAALEPVLPIDPAALFASGGWRSQVKPPETLPHFPVVTGRGGYPDGS